MSHALRPLIPVIAVALAGTALLHVWIRVQPVGMPLSAQVALSTLLVVVVAIVLALVQHVEKDRRGVEDQ